MKKIFVVSIILSLCIALCRKPDVQVVLADSTTETDINNINLTCTSIVSINDVFGDYMSTVDENIYYSLSTVNANTLVKIFGDRNTPMFQKAKQYINPCMAMATTWGESGKAYRGISLTTMMDFNPNTYVDEIDWITVSSNLEQVDSYWYLTHTKCNYNTNVDGYAYAMPTALLQQPYGGSRQTSDMYGLGVGPYQVTSTNWNRYYLDIRVNPVWGWEASLGKVGTSWINCGIDPISDITVYAVLSLGHQGGALINTSFGKSLINYINTKEVQDALNTVGYQMYSDLLQKAYKKDVTLSDIPLTSYLNKLESMLGVDFSNWHADGYGSTNKGDYVIKHCLRYCFYKNYITSGL